MSTYTRRLARWAADLSPDALPDDVLERARMQHLSLAGAVRAGAQLPAARAAARSASARGSARLLHSTRRAARREAARYHAIAPAHFALEDPLLGGWTGPGVAASWAWARDRGLRELLTATVIANEVAGRLGCALLLSERPQVAQQAVSALAAAAAAARLDGLDAAATAAAYALAIQGCRAASDRVDLGPGDSRGWLAAAATADGLDAVAAARAGLSAPADLLDARGGPLWELSPLPLRAAFTGLGQTWLSRTLCFKPQPGHLLLQVPIQATAEILARHIKAADKRLRGDQVERVHLKLPAAALALEARAAAWPGLHPAGVTRSVSRSLGVLLTAHELGPEQLAPAWLERHRDAVARIAGAVALEHDWGLTLSGLERAIDVLTPLLADLRAPELRAVIRRVRARYEDAALGAPGGRQLADFLRLLPGRIQSRLARGSGDLAALDEDSWRFYLGLDMRLFTVRGGWWPERRELPEGGPGWSWEDTRRIVARRFAAGDTAREEVARELLTATIGGGGEDWLDRL